MAKNYNQNNSQMEVVWKGIRVEILIINAFAGKPAVSAHGETGAALNRTAPTTMPLIIL